MLGSVIPEKAESTKDVRQAGEKGKRNKTGRCDQQVYMTILLWQVFSRPTFRVLAAGSLALGLYDCRLMSLVTSVASASSAIATARSAAATTVTAVATAASTIAAARAAATTVTAVAATASTIAAASAITAKVASRWTVTLMLLNRHIEISLDILDRLFSFSYLTVLTDVQPQVAPEETSVATCQYVGMSDL